MKPVVRRSGVAGYGTAVEQLRRELRPTLGALDAVAADAALVDADGDSLAGLQYQLHTAAERVLGLESWPAHEEAHAELHLALSVAREETADLVEALDEAGASAAASLVWEWRVALFGVRLALHRLDDRASAPAEPAEQRRTVLPVVLLALGVAAVLGGALADLWPLWSLGLVVVGVSAGLSHRVP